MDHSQINGPEGFGYDSSAWAQSVDVDQVEPAFFFGGDDSAAVGQQGYGATTEAPTTYPQHQGQGHLAAYGTGYRSQAFDQYQQFAPNTGVEHNPPLQNGHHHAQGTSLLNGYPQAYDVRHSISPAAQQLHYAAPRVASPYQQQAGQGMDGYNDARQTNSGYIQNGAPQQAFPQNQQAQFFNRTHVQQQPALSIQQQQQEQQQQQRVSTPQHQAPSQLLYAQAQQQQAIQQQKRVQAQQQQQHVQPQQHHEQPTQQRGLQQQQHVAAPVYQPQSVGQQRPAVQPQQLPPSQLISQPYVPRPMPAQPPSTATHFATFTPQQQHPGLAVPDRLLRPTGAPVAPTTSERWTGMHHAFVSETPEDASAKFSNETLMPVFARTERRRLFKERPLLIPAEAMGRYMDSLKHISSDDPQAGYKHRIRRLVLEYDLQRVGGLDRDALDTYDKVPKSGPSKFQAEARKRGFEYPPLAPQSSISELDLLEMRTAAMLDLPTTWTPEDGLVQQVAADFAEFLFQVVKELRQLPEYKELLNAIKASKGKSAVSAQDTARSNKLRAVNDKGRERVQRVVATALRVADDRVLAVLSPNRIAIPFQTVINLFNTGDINAPLTKALLSFAGRLPFLDDSMIEGFKWDKLLTRLEDGGDDDVKAAVHKIKDIVKSNEGKPPMWKQASTATIANSEAPAKGASAKVTAAKVSTATATTKRPRKEEDDGDGRVTKKPATSASTSQSSASQTNSQASRAATNPTTSAPNQVKSASTTILTALKARASTGALPGKSRAAAKVASKPEAVKTESEAKPAGNTSTQLSNNLKSEVLKSTTNNSTATSSEPRKMVSNVKKEEIKPEPSRSGSSFAALMSEIEKPKPVKRPAPSPEKTEAPIDETDDERRRRLRKEQRRRLGLRVSFKSEPELTAVRIFHKEEAEDEEREDHMIRDANDDKAEGRLLKASRSSQIDINSEWEEPVLIDFSSIPEEQREKTYTNRGGNIKVETEQQKVMAEKEMTEVMVVYTDAADIPASASSPRAETEMDYEPSGVVVQGDSNLAARAALFMACGARGGLDLLLKRRTAASTSVAALLVHRVQAAAPYQNFEDPQIRQSKDELVLKALNSAPTRSYVDPEPAHPQLSMIRRDYQDRTIQAASKLLEGIVSQLAGLPAPAQEPPKWQQDRARREEWIKGYNNDKRTEEATRQAAQQSALLNYNAPVAQAAQDPYAQYYAQLQAAAQSGSQQQHQQPAQDPVAATLAALQSAGQAAPAQSAQAADPLQAFMAAAFGNQQQQQNSAVDPNQALQLAMWAAASGAAPQQQHQPPSAQQFLNPTGQSGYGQDTNGSGNDYQRDDAEIRNRGGGRRAAGGGSKDGAGSARGDEDHLRGINRSLIGTKPCTFWARGNCNRGDKCTFRHG